MEGEMKVKITDYRPPPRVSVAAFKRISVRFEDDAMYFAHFVALMNEARSTPQCMVRTTIHGLARQLATIADLDVEHVRGKFAAAGLPLHGELELESVGAGTD
jgi:hypothetical protein